MDKTNTSLIAPRSEVVFNTIRNLIDGNQATKNDLTNERMRNQIVPISINVGYTFYGRYSNREKSGSHFENIHFGKSEYEFNKYRDNLIQDSANDGMLRLNFLNKIKNLKENALFENSKELIFHKFEPFSMEKDCNNCNAMGVIKCKNCEGTGQCRCFICGGRRTERKIEYRNVPVYQNGKTVYVSKQFTRDVNCSNCGGRGKTPCRTCNRSGIVECPTCNGAKLVTKIGTIEAVASRGYAVKTNAWENEELEYLLNHQTTSFCADRIEFNLITDREFQPNSHTFYYEGLSVISEYIFSIKNKNYACYSFSNPPNIYVYPAIFDDLFKDELIFLQSVYDKKGHIDKKKAYEFFERYATQPILDLSMKTIAKNHHEVDKFGYMIQNICKGYISLSMANKLGEGLHNIMGKISPSFSKIAWIITLIPFLILIWLFGMVSLQEKSSDFPILGVVVCDGITAIIGCTLAICISYAHVYWIIRKIPKEYHKKIDIRTPMNISLKVCGIVGIIGIFCGTLAHFGYLPILHDPFSKK